VAEKKEQVSADELSVEGSADNQYVQIGENRIRLSRPLELDFRWVGSQILKSR